VGPGVFEASDASPWRSRAAPTLTRSASVGKTPGGGRAEPAGEPGGVSIDRLIAEIARAAERLFGDAGFEGTPEQYEWLAGKAGIPASDDLKWRYVIDQEADDKLDPELPADEAMIAFLGDDEAVQRFLEALLERYRSATQATPPAAPARPRPAHSAAFLAVRDRLIGLHDDADRAALARLFGAIDVPERDPAPELTGLLRSLATLGDEDVVKLARWCRTYVTRAGRIPQATACTGTSDREHKPGP